MCVSGYPNMRLSCRNALPNVRLSVPDTAASIAGEHRALGRREKRFSDGDSGLAMARPGPSSRSGAAHAFRRRTRGDRGLRPRGVLLVGLSVAVGVLVSKFLVRLIGRPVARRVSRQSVAQTIVRGPRRDDHALAARRSLGDRVPLYRPPRGDRRLSAVIGIILAPLVGNFINGVFILADQPFEIGDMIELENGTTGFVEDITIRYTKIFTLDNTFLVVPNGTMRERDVTNYSAEDERTRRTIEVLVTYESDVSEARRLIERRPATATR